MKTGLYFGSFNPIHVGHMAIANYIVEYSDLDEIWFVVSPHNPLKKKKTLLNDHHRIRLVEIAIEKEDRFRISDIETKLPKPSYTIDTLTYLVEKFPSFDFSLIMGGDNLLSLHKWKNAVQLVKRFPLYVYPRKETDIQNIPELNKILSLADITVVNAPLIEISGTFIRESIKLKKDIRHFLPPGVWQYIIEMHFFE